MLRSSPQILGGAVVKTHYNLLAERDRVLLVVEKPCPPKRYPRRPEYPLSALMKEVINCLRPGRR